MPKTAFVDAALWASIVASFALSSSSWALAAFFEQWQWFSWGGRLLLLQQAAWHFIIGYIQCATTPSPSSMRHSRWGVSPSRGLCPGSVLFDLG
jgi:hypothetical protein